MVLGARFITKQPLVNQVRPPLLFFKTATLLSTQPPLSSSSAETHSRPTCPQHSHLHSSNSPLLSINYADLFSLLKSPPHLPEARRLHARLLVGGFFHPATTDPVLGSQLVSVYVGLDSLEEALGVFHKLPCKNNIAWNAILRGFVMRSHFSRAIDFYHSMLEQGVVPDNYTYPLVLKACAGMRSLQEGLKVIESIGFSAKTNINIHVQCAIIDMFAKCGRLDQARMSFDDMPSKDLASWTAIICATVHNGQCLQAMSLFASMKSQGIQPDSQVVASVLPACARLEAGLLGMALHGCAVRSGFDTDLFVSNALLDLYCKRGDTRRAYSLFCCMDRDAVSWSTLIAGYSQNGLYMESVELYLEMINSFGVKTNAVIAASVLPGFAELKMLKQGKEMHNFILRRGFESDVVVGSALIDMYVNCGLNKEAKCVFQIMSDKDITIWNSMIAGHASNDDFDSSFRTFRKIFCESQLKPNSITLVTVLPLCTKVGALRLGQEIHGYATRTGLGEAVSVGNSLMDMYCKNGYLELGVKVFDHMMEKNVVTYNTIISAQGIHGQGEQAFSYFCQMEAAQIRPTKVTFIALLSACSHAGLIDRGWFIYSSKMRDYGVLPDTEHHSCMVDLLGRAGRVGDACEFVKGLPVEPDINILGSLLGACRVHNKVELADFVGRQIFKNKLKDPGYHVLLSNIYASTERWVEASKLRTMIKDDGLTKKPGKSWIQIGNQIHFFHARGTNHPELDEIHVTLGNLLLEMKSEGYVPEPGLFPRYHMGDGNDRMNLSES